MRRSPRVAGADLGLAPPLLNESSAPLRSGQLCEFPPSPLSLCELADCQNKAPCVERGGRALCQCPPEFGGPRCEKLVSVNFVDRDSYLLLSDLKNWPQANITLQVFTARGGASPGLVQSNCESLIRTLCVGVDS